LVTKKTIPDSIYLNVAKNPLAAVPPLLPLFSAVVMQLVVSDLFILLSKVYMLPVNLCGPLHVYVGEGHEWTQQEHFTCRIGRHMAGPAARPDGPEHPDPAGGPVAAGVLRRVAPRVSSGHGCLHLQPGWHLHQHHLL